MSNTAQAVMGAIFDSAIFILIGLAIIIIFGVVIFMLIKNRHKIFANAWVEVLGVNSDHNIINRRMLPGKIDKGNNMKEIFVKDLEETLSIENVYPLKSGKRDLYYAVQVPDGKIYVVNPSIIENTFTFDSQFLDYKRWYSYIIPTLYQDLMQDQIEKATRKVIVLTIASIIGACVIIGTAIYFGFKLGWFSVSQTSNTVQTITGSLKALSQNVTLVR